MDIGTFSQCHHANIQSLQGREVISCQEAPDSGAGFGMNDLESCQRLTVSGRGAKDAILSNRVNPESGGGSFFLQEALKRHKHGDTYLHGPKLWIAKLSF